MKRRKITGSHSTFEGINATPLIDVVMCLIIFFLVVGKLATDRGYAVPLPGSSVGQDETSASVLVVTVAQRPDGRQSTGSVWDRLGITVQADGEVCLDVAALEGAVRTKLREVRDTSIQVRGDKFLQFGQIEPVLRACGQAGAKSVRFATEKEP